MTTVGLANLNDIGPAPQNVIDIVKYAKLTMGTLIFGLCSNDDAALF